jgi:hypothetical protein
LQVGLKYFYAVTAVDSAQAIPESWKSDIDSVLLSHPPKLISAEVVNDRELTLKFNENVAFSIGVPQKVLLKLSEETASSIIILKEKNKILASFDKSFTVGESDTILVEGVFNENGIPLDLRFNELFVDFPQQEKEPYVTAVEIADRYHVHIQFNQSMLQSSLVEIANYVLEPNGSVLDVEVEDSLNTKIYLTLDGGSMAGALGAPAYIVMNNIKSEDGVLLSEGNKINLFREEDGLNGIIIYPQPVRAYHNEVIFAKLPKYVEINIFNLSGVKIWSLRENSQYGGIHWDLTDSNGYKVKSGIYIYEIRSGDERKLGKIAIMR